MNKDEILKKLEKPVFNGNGFELHEPDKDGDFELNDKLSAYIYINKEEAKGMADFIYKKLNR